MENTRPRFIKFVWNGVVVRRIHPNTSKEQKSLYYKYQRRHFTFRQKLLEKTKDFNNKILGVLQGNPFDENEPTYDEILENLRKLEETL